MILLGTSIAVAVGAGIHLWRAPTTERTTARVAGALTGVAALTTWLGYGTHSVPAWVAAAYWVGLTAMFVALKRIDAEPDETETEAHPLAAETEVRA